MGRCCLECAVFLLDAQEPKTHDLRKRASAGNALEPMCACPCFLSFLAISNSRSSEDLSYTRFSERQHMINAIVRARSLLPPPFFISHNTERRADCLVVSGCSRRRLHRHRARCPALPHAPYVLVPLFLPPRHSCHAKKRIDQAVSTASESALKRLTRQGPSSFLPLIIDSYRLGFAQPFKREPSPPHVLSLY